MPIEFSTTGRRDVSRHMPKWCVDIINRKRAERDLAPLAGPGLDDDDPRLSAEQRLYNARRLAKIAMAETRKR